MNEYLNRLPYWDKLTETQKDFIARNTVVVSYRKGEYLKDGNTSCLGMVHVLSGSIRILMLSKEGREVTLFRLAPGDSCVFSASCVLSQISFETQMVATENTSILLVNSGAYARLMEENMDVKCFSYELAIERASGVIWVLQQIIFAKFDERLADFLIKTCEKAGKSEITMTKEAIAQEVNTAREVVSRMLKQFESDGLISMNQKTITVIDMEGLKKII